MRTAVRGLLFAVIAALWASCGGNSSPAAPTTTTPVTPATPVVTRISISGNFALTTIGETTQLTAALTYSDNSTKDVTSEGRWSVVDTRVVVVSPTGLVTVVGYGATWISFNFGMRNAGNTVTATPAGTFVISGRVRQPGAGGLDNVAVLDALSRRTATTAQGGLFSMGSLPSLHVLLRVAAAGYEPVELDALVAPQAQVDIPVQQVVRIAVGETVTPHPLAPNDLSYTIGNDRCDDCRLIRVVAARAGSLRVRVTWTQTATKLRLFVQGQIATGGIGELTVDTQIDSPGEMLMYLGVMPSTSANHTSFIFTTSWN